MELEFVFEKATKNTYRFEEVPSDDHDVVVGTLYVKKYAFETQPQILTLTIEVSNE